MSARIGRSDRGRALVAVVAGAMFLGPATARGAVAGHMGRLAAGTGAFVSDGERYVAWQLGANGPVVVYDTHSGRQRRLQVPSDCSLLDKEGDGGPTGSSGRFLLECRDRWKTVDTRSAALRDLPSPGGSNGSWQSIGRRYVEGFALGGDCSQSRAEAKHGVPCIVLYDLFTGRVSYRPQSQVGDLDQAGAPLVCGNLRSRLIAIREATLDAGTTAYSGGVLAQPARHGDVRVTLCDGHTVLLHGTGEVENLDVRGGIITWDTGHPGISFNAETLELPVDIKQGSLYSYDLRTRRRTTWTLPQLVAPVSGEPRVPRVLGYSTHTRSDVFWSATSKVNAHSAYPRVEESTVFIAHAG